MVSKSVLISEAESNGASEEFLKFLEAGYEMNVNSLVYGKIENAVSDEKEFPADIESYMNHGGDFVRELWDGGDVKLIYNLADSKNSRILEKAYPEKLG